MICVREFLFFAGNTVAQATCVDATAPEAGAGQVARRADPSPPPPSRVATTAAPVPPNVTKPVSTRVFTPPGTFDASPPVPPGPIFSMPTGATSSALRRRRRAFSHRRATAAEGEGAGDAGWGVV